VTSPKKAPRASRRHAAARKAAGSAPASLVRCADLPWFPFLSDGVHLKLCQLNRSTGEMAFLIRLDPGSGLGTRPTP
jgi:hypothetical protein